jgi:hypothetical protein
MPENQVDPRMPCVRAQRVRLRSVMVGARPSPHRLLMLVHSIRRHEEPAEPFLACHARIRSITELVCRLCDTRDAKETDIAKTARTVHWYFAMAFPLHTEDEDLSLAPRLLGAPVSREVENAIALQAAQHPIIESITSDVADMALAVARDPVSLSSVRQPLGTLAAGLGAVWETHLGLEERVIFPALRELPRASVQEMIAECESRRRIDHVKPIALGRA